MDSDGVSWTTVYLDGGWSHRSYGHSYNASSGVVHFFIQFYQKENLENFQNPIDMVIISLNF